MKSTFTLPEQGPGTKLVLKGLKRAFPRIAEQREREEREEREEKEREEREREHVSLNNDGKNRQKTPIGSNSSRQGVHSQPEEQRGRGRSVYSNSGNSRNHKQSERNTGPENIRQGQSNHSNKVDRESHNQSRDHTRSESVGQGQSVHSHAGNRGSHVHFKDSIPQDNASLHPSLHSNAGNTEKRGSPYQSRDNLGPEPTQQRLSTQSSPEDRVSHRTSRPSTQATMASRRDSNESTRPTPSTESRRSEHDPTPHFQRRRDELLKDQETMNLSAGEIPVRYSARHSRQSSTRPDGSSHLDRASARSSNMGPRRTASTHATAESRETARQTDDRRSGRGRA